MQELPHDNIEYSKRDYWDQRYSNEGEYDWLLSVYPNCLAAAFQSVEKVYEEQRRCCLYDSNETPVIKVVHLGVGNSNICADLYKLYAQKYRDPNNIPYLLIQIAIDYSEVVIAKMRLKHAEIPNTHWVVADVRQLGRVRDAFGSPFDVVIDKCTMDVFQVDKITMEENIHEMLHEVSLCFKDPANAAFRRYGHFIQFTWEIPYSRLWYTLAKGSSVSYAWGTNASYRFLGDSDLYRLYVYEVQC